MFKSAAHVAESSKISILTQKRLKKQECPKIGDHLFGSLVKSNKDKAAVRGGKSYPTKVRQQPNSAASQHEVAENPGELSQQP